MLNAVAIQPRFATKRAVVHVENPLSRQLSYDGANWADHTHVQRNSVTIILRSVYSVVEGVSAGASTLATRSQSEPVDGHEPILFPSDLPGKSTGGLQLAHNELSLWTSLRRVDKNVLSPNP